jgi:hypothetical protein
VVPALGLVLAVLTWRDVVFAPIPGLDPSWHAGLHMAARRRMAFGDELVFTFGPLGFLTQPVVYYASTGLLSALYGFGLQAALCTSLLDVVRRTVALPLAAVLTFLVVSAGRELKAAETVVVVAVLVAVGLLRGDHSPRTERILVVAAGVAAGTHLLVKFNTGVIVALVGLVTAWFVGRRGWRSLAVFAGAAAVSVLAGWLVTGNSLADLVPYVDGSLQVASGYSESLGIDLEERNAFYPAAVAVTLVVVALGWRAARPWPAGRRAGLALIGAAWLYAALKHGFVRHDEHDIVFFGEALLVGTALAAAARPSLRGRTQPLLAGAGTAALLVVYLLAAEVPVKAVVNPLPAVRRAGDDAATFASSGRRSRAIEASRARLREAYGLTAPVLASLEGRTVHVRPWEAQLAWAYPEMRWRPVPVFQEYTAYTAGLDRIDADFLSGPRAPERIVYEEVFVDFRNPDWESPAATLAIACHYRQLPVSQPRWQVLAHAGDRCGAPRPLGTVFARVGDTVPVPDPGDPDAIVVARVRGLDGSPLYALRAALLRIPHVHVALDGDRRYRLVPGTAANGLIVRSPAILGFDEPFAPGSAATLRVEHGGGLGLGDTLTIEFVAVPVIG